MRVSRMFLLGMAALLTAGACGRSEPPPPPAPAVDEDALRREEAARRAREDSIARARAAETERIAAQRRADSLAAIEREVARVRDIVAQRVHFDFDRSAIRPGDAAVLDRKLAVLQANPSLRIRIIGHCDERGSDEYNLALGNRRASAARQYLMQRGISGDRIETESRGKREPLVRASNEEAWAQNRRAEFVITAGGDRLQAPAGM